MGSTYLRYQPETKRIPDAREAKVWERMSGIPPSCCMHEGGKGSGAGRKRIFFKGTYGISNRFPSTGCRG